MRTPWLWAVAVLGGLGVSWLLGLRRQVDVDVWLHLRIGQYLRDGGRFGPGPDPFVTLADRTYVPTQWLAEVVGSWLHDLGGMTALHVARLVCLLLLGLVVLATARASCGPVTAGVVTVLALFGTSAAWAERPQLTGLVCFAVTLWLWDRARRLERVPWLVVPLTWLWAMLHGSWVLGLAAGGLYVAAMALERPRRPRAWGRLVGVVVASTAVVALTPLGPRLLIEPLLVTDVARDAVNEWQRPAPSNPLLLLVLALGAVAVIRALRSRPRRIPEILLAAGAIALALWSVRTIAFGSLLVVPALAGTFVPSERREPSETHAPAGPSGVVPGAVLHGRRLALGREERWAWLLAAILAAVLPGAVIGAPGAAPVSARIASAVDALPAGDRVVVEPALTGWVLWAQPDLVPLRDLRVEVYSSNVAAAYERFLHAEPGWQDYAAEHDVDAALLADDSALAAALRHADGWTLVAASGGFALWRRTG